jgi:hypothetical protein
MASRILPNDHRTAHPGRTDEPETDGTRIGTAAIGSGGDVGVVGDRVDGAMMRIHPPAIDSRRTYHRVMW